MSNLPEKFNPKEIKWNEISSLELSNKGKEALRTFMLNQSPTKNWLKKHPVYGNTYLPIDKVEFLLTVFFGKWNVEIKQSFQIANSICVTVRLYYMNPETGQYDWQDGAGAAPMQVDSGAKAMNSEAVKPNAVMLALPIAETNAVKDAADKIGKIFGRDLNRKDVLAYDVLLKNEELLKNAKITQK